MNAYVYSCWDGSPGDCDSGVLNRLEESINIHPERMTELRGYLKKDIRFFKQDRVFGRFILLFDTPCGAVLVSENFQRVYVALGISESIGYAVGATEAYSQFSRPIGYFITTTLLPWDGMIVYDGLLNSSLSAVHKSHLRRAIEAFIDAIDTNTLIISLPRDPTFLDSNLSAATTTAPKIDTEALKILLGPKIHAIASMSEFSQPGSHWPFLRHGYTKEDNPKFIITVMRYPG
jgi:hypothetical protein